MGLGLLAVGRDCQHLAAKLTDYGILVALLITSTATSNSLQMIAFCIELSQVMMTTMLSRLILSTSTNGHWTGKWHLMSSSQQPMPERTNKTGHINMVRACL